MTWIFGDDTGVWGRTSWDDIVSGSGQVSSDGSLTWGKASWEDIVTWGKASWTGVEKI